MLDAKMSSVCFGKGDDLGGENRDVSSDGIEVTLLLTLERHLRC